MFTTEEATAIPTVTMATTGMAFNPATYQVAPGETVKLNIELNGSVTGGDGKIAVEPDAAIYTVGAVRTGEGNSTEAVALNSRTYVDAAGILHTQKTGLEVGDVITVTATSVYTNPSGQTPTYTATATVTVVAPTAQGAKECAVETDPYITYTDETTEATASE